MKAVHNFLPVAVLAFAGYTVIPAHAQAGGAATSANAPAAELSDGEVRKIDKDSGKITLRHGPIKNLDMPPMTMVFQVTDAVLLDKVKAGDKIRFAAVNESGKLTVTRIEPTR